MKLGVVGLPNVGKSTLFNAITHAGAEAANYPFCTIEPNKATVPVPARRIAALDDLVHPQKTITATVDFIDIAGLVRGASKGEGLGNQFLGNIRECAAILEVVRCLEDDDITHVDGSVAPLRDIDTNSKLRFSHENPSVVECYEKYFGEPNSEKAEQLLHSDHFAWGMPAARQQ